jgi:hypothetical protein
MRALCTSGVVLSVLVAAVLGCGSGKDHVACSGTTCLDVSGNYSATALSPASGNTCTKIVYGGSVGADGGFPANFTIGQTGSAVTFAFQGSSLSFQVNGTLFADHSATFADHLAHITVSGPDGDFDYADDTSVSLQFSPGANGAMQVTGSLSDVLNANAAGGPLDQTCSLHASINGQR